MLLYVNTCMYKFINCHSGHFFKCYYINGEEHIPLWFFLCNFSNDTNSTEIFNATTTVTKTAAPTTKRIPVDLPKKGSAEEEHHSSFTIFFILLVVGMWTIFFDYYSSLIHRAHFEYDFIYYGFTRSLFIWVFWKKVWLYWKMISSYACITKNLILFINYWLVSYFSIGNIDHTHAYSNKVSLPTRKYCRHIIRYILSFQNI